VSERADDRCGERGAPRRAWRTAQAV